MQATRPISNAEHELRTALMAIIVTIAIAAALALATMAPTIGGAAQAGAGANVRTAPLLLDPDARGHAGARNGLVHVAQ